MRQTDKNLLVLFSGGDTPTMTSMLYAVLRLNERYKCYNNVYAVYDAYRGLVEDKPGDIVIVDDSFFKKLRQTPESIMASGYAFLGCARYDFKGVELVKAAADTCTKYNADLLAFGGDGTMCAAKELADRGVHVNSVPASIDNDLTPTQYMGGLDSALNVNVASIDALQNCGRACKIFSIKQVMGRKSGYIALMCAIATGCIAIIPEMTVGWTADDYINYLTKVIKDMVSKGIESFTFLIAEGIVPICGVKDENANTVNDNPVFVYELAEKLKKTTGKKVEASIAGREQRACTPTALDRIMSVAMASRAYELLSECSDNYLVGIENGHTVSIPLKSALEKLKIDRKENNTVSKELFSLMCKLYPDWVTDIYCI